MSNGYTSNPMAVNYNNNQSITTIIIPELNNAQIQQKQPNVIRSNSKMCLGNGTCTKSGYQQSQFSVDRYKKAANGINNLALMNQKDASVRTFVNKCSVGCCKTTREASGPATKFDNIKSINNSVSRTLE